MLHKVFRWVRQTHEHGGRSIKRDFVLILIAFTLLSTSGIGQENATSYVNKSLVLEGQGKYDEAIKALDEAIRINPNYTEAYNNKGIVLGEQGDLGKPEKYDEAIKAFDEAIWLNPYNFEAYYNKGNALIKQGDLGKPEKYDEAIKAFDEAIWLNPYYANAWYYKSLTEGLALDRKGKYDEAIKAFDEAIGLNPNNAMAYNEKGIALAKQGDLGKHDKYDEAIEAFDEAIRLNPNYTEAYNNKGTALGKQGDLGKHDKYDEAIKAFDEAIKVNPNLAQSWYSKGLALYKQGDYDEAIKAFDNTTKIDPQYVDAWVGKGITLYNQGKYDEAIKAFDEVMGLNPDYAIAWNNKGVTLYKLGKYDEAIKAYDEVIRLDPYYNEAYTNKGLALNGLGKYNESIQNFDTVLERNPKSVGAWRGKSEALQNLNHTGEATIASANANDLEMPYCTKIIICITFLFLYLLLAIFGYRYILSKASYVSAGSISSLTNLLGLWAFNWTFAGLFDIMLLGRLLITTSFVIIITSILLGFLEFPLASFWRRLDIAFQCLFGTFEEFDQSHTRLASTIKIFCLMLIIIYPVVSIIFYLHRPDVYPEQIMLYYLRIDLITYLKFNLLTIPVISLMITIPVIIAEMLSINSDRDTLNTLLAFQFSNLGINSILIFVALWTFGLFRSSFSKSIPFLIIAISLFTFFLLPYLVGWQTEKKMRELFLRKEYTLIEELLDILEFSTPSLCIEKLQQLYAEIKTDKTEIEADTTCGVSLVKEITEVEMKGKKLNYGRSLLNEAVIQERTPCSDHLDFLKKLQDNLGPIISQLYTLERDTDKFMERAYRYAGTYHARKAQIAKRIDDVKSAKPLLWLALASVLSLMISVFVNSFSQTLIQALPQLAQASGGLFH